MKKLSLLILLMLSPILSFSKAPDCHNWPMNMTKGWLKNANITNIYNLDVSKTKITLLASEKKEKDLYTQIYHFVFYDKKGKSYEVITKNEASDEECSMSQVNSYLISKRDINY
ncbi:hypothetical protein [Snodgrassella alvi]|uniref:hypothetical protein n=2 Tax=Snodgrassella alvi TaxID=1196083 RepID=UPI000C1F33B7|nr:hypothetical protein [Snodgrassella alvi]PIT12886.1 hypothetical protein BGI33_12375 [Snodgrassella alvi]PIT17205.1 hypothetical protein BGI34_07970 [Snodgrassella alvi]PIT17275.1 hypothetical protein BGI33_03220 [Snodgrassella alvi]